MISESQLLGGSDAMQLNMSHVNECLSLLNKLAFNDPTLKVSPFLFSFSFIVLIGVCVCVQKGLENILIENRNSKNFLYFILCVCRIRSFIWK